MEFLEELFQSEAFYGLMLLIITSVFGAIGTFAKQYKDEKVLEAKAKREELIEKKGLEHVQKLEAIAGIAVKFVENAFKELDGPAKLAKAIEEAKNNVAGTLDISDERMEKYIEAAHLNMKQGYEKGATVEIAEASTVTIEEPK